MSDPTEVPPAPSQESLSLHAKAVKYAHGINDLVAATFGDGNPHPYPFAGGALRRLGADAVAYHEAVFAVCAGSWAHCSSPLLRTLLDELLNVVVIAEDPDEADLRGFRCTHFFLKPDLSSDDEAVRERAKEIVDTSLENSRTDFRESARRFLFQERQRAYWFPPEYRGPQDVAEEALVVFGAARLLRQPR